MNCGLFLADRLTVSSSCLQSAQLACTVAYRMLKAATAPFHCSAYCEVFTRFLCRSSVTSRYFEVGRGHLFTLPCLFIVYDRDVVEDSVMDKCEEIT